jgi:hypothetical protein
VDVIVIEINPFIETTDGALLAGKVRDQYLKIKNNFALELLSDQGQARKPCCL